MFVLGNGMLIETERLCIRSFAEDDKDAYVEIATDPDVMKYIGNGRARTRDQAEQSVVKNIQTEKNDGYARYAVILKETNRLIGFCGYASLFGNIDLGWQYAKRYWKKGYGTEAARRALEYGTSILQFTLIVSFAHPENVGSLKIMENIGMTRIGDWVLPDGRLVIRYEHKSTPK